MSAASVSAETIAPSNRIVRSRCRMPLLLPTPPQGSKEGAGVLTPGLVCLKYAKAAGAPSGPRRLESRHLSRSWTGTGLSAQVAPQHEAEPFAFSQTPWVARNSLSRRRGAANGCVHSGGRTHEVNRGARLRVRPSRVRRFDGLC